MRYGCESRNLNIAKPLHADACHKYASSCRAMCTKQCQNHFQVVAVLKKEVTKTHNDSEQEEIGGYRQVCTCAIIYTKCKL